MLLIPVLIDHKDGDGLNNQKYNLRRCNKQQNNFNARKRSDGLTSQYKGVYFDKTSKGYKKWAATILLNKKRIFLGRFKIEKDAAIAYDKKAIELFGDFALLNITLTQQNKTP